MRVADIAWIGTALLHRENPDRDDFRAEEILRRSETEFGPLQPGVRQHLGSHAVASIKPTPGRYRMFTRTERGKLRLYRTGDPSHPDRKGKILPAASDVPEKYRPLLEWYERSYSRKTKPTKQRSPEAFLAFIGLIPAYDLKLMEEAIERDFEMTEDDNASFQ